MKVPRFTTVPCIRFKFDPLQAVTFLKTLGRLWTIWPLDAKASKFRRVYHECSLWFIMINLFIILLAVWNEVLESRDHPVIMAKALSQLMIGIDSFSHLLFYKFHLSKLRVLLQEVSDFMRSCRSYERNIMKAFYKQCFPLYMILFVLFSIASTFFFCVAFMTKQTFPVDAKYPFSTKSTVAIAIIYIHQTFSILQNAVILLIDFFVITLFWFAGARFQVLKYHLKAANSDASFRKCIIDHQKIIRFTQKAVHTVRFILYKTISVVALILISAGIQLLYIDAAAVLSQFTLIVIVASLRIITYCSTIEEMKQMSDNLCWIVYTSDGIQRYWISRKNLTIFIHRCQMPLVTVNGYILNIMSMKFFGKFMYTTISHLITLRAIIERSSE